ncbi:DUF2490 domain-containing protein [Salinimicrobium terrae]|uniref:DUF2490 domain-containing protein n=1 Tax=Salinimicrobium terrae TaxID=470866 RepID=UPI0004263BE3|nr:DUF2490 domain-containing protein [Salinimicrobium terrae]
MKSSRRNKLTVFVLFLVLGCNVSFSQNPHAYFYENEFGLSLPVSTDWSMDIGAGYRGLLQERSLGKKIESYQSEHIELNHFTDFKANPSLVLSLGLRYRFRELFNPSAIDEFRIIEQVKIQPANSTLPLSHRFRVEQRFREHTIHRVRYQLGFSQPVGKGFSFKAATEALYAVSANLKPEAEQRFSLGVENSSLQDLELGLSLEYRLGNYALDPAHEFFVVTGVSLSL